MPEIFPQLAARTGRQMLKPIRANADPLAPVPVIAKALAERMRLAFAKGANSVVVLIDREGHDDSASRRAKDIETALAKLVTGKFYVVVKDRMYENWLLACPDAFAKQPARFAQRRHIDRSPVGRADAVADPAKAINLSITRGEYEKVADSIRIMRHADVEKMAQNSRSFRRLLAVLGDPAYATSSCTFRPSESMGNPR